MRDLLLIFSLLLFSSYSFSEENIVKTRIDSLDKSFMLPSKTWQNIVVKPSLKEWNNNVGQYQYKDDRSVKAIQQFQKLENIQATKGLRDFYKTRSDGVLEQHVMEAKGMFKNKLSSKLTRLDKKTKAKISEELASVNKAAMKKNIEKHKADKKQQIQKIVKMKSYKLMSDFERIRKKRNKQLTDEAIKRNNPAELKMFKNGTARTIIDVDKDHNTINQHLKNINNLLISKEITKGIIKRLNKSLEKIKAIDRNITGNNTVVDINFIQGAIADLDSFNKKSDLFESNYSLKERNIPALQRYLLASDFEKKLPLLENKFGTDHLVGSLEKSLKSSFENLKAINNGSSNINKSKNDPRIPEDRAEPGEAAKRPAENIGQ